ncbi:ATP-dependent zinc metalloprotease FtsH [Thermosulfurimonas marina]|uniref:ATP-dependent zinc metalloprotease FtsH n=1 Tax=Thermosulfurimonas marina TaxID=2047767 RepID=A0A6H1WUR7_9BACT|nr:ATP-dependent zinc metalloprotease FtsH [Thermosulfurimonas marina]QJA06921.1 ATP-dependent zinc metalloprotease FtsH [Thermosulfurimonas marina]
MFESFWRKLGVGGVILLCFLTIAFTSGVALFCPGDIQTLSFSEFVQKVERGEIQEVKIKGEEIKGADVTGKRFRVILPDSSRVLPFLERHLVKVQFEKGRLPGDWITWVLLFLSASTLGLVFLAFLRPSPQPSRLFSFLRSRAQIISPEKVKVRFSDVAGVEEAKEELQEVVEFLKGPSRFVRLGGRMPKGILLVGPPGTGKTLLAKAVAGEAGVPFFSISGSDFVEMFVGVGAARVRDLFAEAKKHKPCIIFIDEIDAVGRSRGVGAGGGHEEREQTLNQLLVEMDGFESEEGIVVLAATNRPDILDPALLRPGRFDRRIEVPPPDVRGREAILRVHARKIRLSPEVDLSELARATPGFTGADLANLLNEAALLAARQGKEMVDREDLEKAKDKILLGRERKGVVISEEEKQLAAYHEAGHALMAYLLPGTDPIYKISILPRAHTLGVVQQLPLDDRHVYSRDYLFKQIMILLGGRVAEEYIFGQATTGAGDDLARATEIARRMVCEWGMSKQLGPLVFPPRPQEKILMKYEEPRAYSEKTAQLIDEEVYRVVGLCYAKDREVLAKHIKYLHILAETLLEKETLDGEALKKLLADLKPLREEDVRLPED